MHNKPARSQRPRCSDWTVCGFIAVYILYFLCAGPQLPQNVWTVFVQDSLRKAASPPARRPRGEPPEWPSAWFLSDNFCMVTMRSLLWLFLRSPSTTRARNGRNVPETGKGKQVHFITSLRWNIGPKCKRSFHRKSATTASRLLFGQVHSPWTAPQRYLSSTLPSSIFFQRRFEESLGRKYEAVVIDFRFWIRLWGGIAVSKSVHGKYNILLFLFPSLSFSNLVWLCVYFCIRSIPVSYWFLDYHHNKRWCFMHSWCHFISIQGMQ